MIRLTHLALAAGLLSASALATPQRARRVRPPRPLPSHAQGNLTRINLDQWSNQLSTCTTGCKNSSHPSISDDGQRIVYDSDARDVVRQGPNPNFTPQIYLRDMTTGTTQLISTPGPFAPANAALANGACNFPSISGDGEYVAYASWADNLDTDDHNAKSDIFLHEIATGRTERATEIAGGIDPDGRSGGAALDRTARHVAFWSYATNLVPLVTPGCPQPPAPNGNQEVYLLDRASGTFEWISLGVGCTVADGPSLQPTLDRTGTLVCFGSSATNLVPGDLNGATFDVFVRDRTIGFTLPISVLPNGRLDGDGHSSKPAIASRGRYVVFESLASNLVAGDTNGVRDIFVRDMALQQTVRVSVSTTGVQSNNHSTYPAISGDGRIVAFASTATNLVVGDTTAGYLDFFRHDRDVSGNGIMDEPGDTETIRLSIGFDLSEGNSVSGGNTSISEFGHYIPFMSHASNLVPGDTNGSAPGHACSPSCTFGRDIFLYVD